MLDLVQAWRAVSMSKDTGSFGGFALVCSSFSTAVVDLVTPSLPFCGNVSLELRRKQQSRTVEKAKTRGSHCELSSHAGTKM